MFEFDIKKIIFKQISYNIEKVYFMNIASKKTQLVFFQFLLNYFYFEKKKKNSSKHARKYKSTYFVNYFLIQNSTSKQVLNDMVAIPILTLV